MWGRVFPYQAKGECQVVEAAAPEVTVDQWYAPPPEPIRTAFPIALLAIACATAAYPYPPTIDQWHVSAPGPTKIPVAPTSSIAVSCAMEAYPRPPTIDQWHVSPPGPTKIPVALTSSIVVASTQLFYPLPAPAIDCWYAPPPDPIPSAQATPHLYQSIGWDITATLPPPPVDGWHGPTTGWNRIQKIQAAGDGQALLIFPTELESWHSPSTDPIWPPGLPRALYPQGPDGPVLVIALDVLPDLYYSPPPEPIPPRQLPIALYLPPAAPPAVIGADSEQVDQWYAPPPEPIPARQATPHLYQDATYDATAILPVPPIDRWQVLQPQPEQPIRLPMALYPVGPPEPVVALPTAIEIDHWYSPPPEPIYPRRAAPWLERHGYELGSLLSPPTGFPAPVLGIYACRRPGAGRLVLGVYATRRQEIGT